MSAVAGSLYGLAYGDALGAPTEFRGIAEIHAMYGTGGPADLPEPALVTDDTQMALAVADALLAALEGGHRLSPNRFEPLVRDRFLAWWKSPENDRAPGMTCLNACAGMAEGRPWRDATVIGSKGCGANMRVTPIALVPGLDLDDRTGAAQLQAAMTHGHPTALAASELTMLATLWALDGRSAADLPGLLRTHADRQRTVYREDWLGDLWTRTPDADPQRWIARGWDDCIDALDRLDRAVALPDREADPCLATGAGWVAEEALATALHCVLLFPDDPGAALRRAAVTSGDSDSIAALAGAIIGAAHGFGGWPATWAERIEYGDQLARISAAWTTG